MARSRHRLTASLAVALGAVTACDFYLTDYELATPMVVDGGHRPKPGHAGARPVPLPDAASGAGGQGGGAGAPNVLRDASGDSTDASVEHDNRCTTDDDCRSGSACAIRRCMGGSCVAVPVEAGVACGKDDSGVCSGGKCIGRCEDGLLDGEETDVDCGGHDCAPCEAQKLCDTSSDCRQELCVIVAESPPANRCSDGCSDDGKKNGGETGVDCGAACARRCGLGSTCDADADCSSGFCVDNVCCGTHCAGTCSRCEPSTGACVQLEEGMVSDRCPNHETCTASGTCASCENGKFDPKLGETGVDCGGGTCPRCGVDATCSKASDCATCLCEANVCQAKRCNDHLKDGCESDVDCGGPCGPCGIGQACASKTDCASSSCGEGRCVP